MCLWNAARVRSPRGSGAVIDSIIPRGDDCGSFRARRYDAAVLSQTIGGEMGPCRSFAAPRALLFLLVALVGGPSAHAAGPVLYVTDAEVGLYTLDPSTAAATLVGEFGPE